VLLSNADHRSRFVCCIRRSRRRPAAVIVVAMIVDNLDATSRPRCSSSWRLENGLLLDDG